MSGCDIRVGGTSSFGARALLLLLVAEGALGSLHVLPARAQEMPADDRMAIADLQTSGEVTIWINGTLIGAGAVTSDDSVFMRVTDLIRAVDGDSSAPSTRFVLANHALYAVAEGGCAGCPIRVARAVLISGSIRLLNGQPYVPLVDLIRAFEGRLDTGGAAGAYRIYAGACSWCILEPAAGHRR